MVAGSVLHYSSTQKFYYNYYVVNVVRRANFPLLARELMICLLLSCLFKKLTYHLKNAVRNRTLMQNLLVSGGNFLLTSRTLFYLAYFRTTKPG
jgi:hypothetical protein